ncbi:MAG TPA: Hsp70 family protein, partial [Terriglobales bacterium]
MKTSAVGVDFGTTNSTIAYVNPSGKVELAQFSDIGHLTNSYRSLLYLEQVRENGNKITKSWTGPEGIQHYLSADDKGRLMQSLKSFLANRSLLGTEIFGRRYTVEWLIARILKDLREHSEAQFGVEIKTAMVGRPVQFVGAEKEQDNLYAEARLTQAFHAAGYENISFESEPVAAAHYYESTLDQDQLILIGDFGGGTSDFSLIRVGPTIRRKGRTPADLLGNAGVGVAGDNFDARIIKHLVAPALGSESQIKSLDKV